MAGAEPEQVAVPLDDVDRKIIAELTRDGRMSVTQVAENVHISRAHAYTRIARLTARGVLTKFTAPSGSDQGGAEVIRLCNTEGAAALLARA